MNHVNLAIPMQAGPIALVRRIGAYALAAAAVLIAAGARTSANAQELRPDEAVPLQLYEGPRAQELADPRYPKGIQNEGWVHVGFMIDPAGKPYEAVVLDSAGDKAFEAAALDALSRSTFKPASLAGTPVDAGAAYKFVFAVRGRTGARKSFASAFDDLMEAVESKDQAAADALLSRMEAKNLYEDAYLGFAQYAYASVWGNSTAQLKALRRAVAHEEGARYLRKQLFQSALSAMLKAEIEANDFAAALITWERLKKSGVNKERLANWEQPIARIKALRTDDRAYAVDGTIGSASSWFLRLHKKRFRVQVDSGRIQELKLRCDTQYVLFPFDPQLQYNISEKAGSCGLEVLGEVGSHFKLIQL